jgi:hypothetical protein
MAGPASALCECLWRHQHGRPTVCTCAAYRHSTQLLALLPGVWTAACTSPAECCLAIVLLGLQVLFSNKMNVLLLLLPLAITSKSLGWAAGATFLLSLLPLCSLAEVSEWGQPAVPRYSLCCLSSSSISCVAWQRWQCCLAHCL